MRQANWLAFLGALALHIAITVVWYVTLPHAPPLSTLIPWGGLFLCGLVLGLFVIQFTIRYAVTLGVLMPLTTSLIHMVFVSAGKVEDARTLGVALLLGAMLLPISIPLAYAGALLGAWLRKCIGLAS